MTANLNTFRILVIDDTPSIHDDFRKVLGISRDESAKALADLESQLFGAESSAASEKKFEIDSALQGQAGVEKLKQALAEKRPYAMAFVDMRMPPGWDGVQTIRELWKVDPNLQVAICTAYSDYSPDQISAELKLDGRMLIVRKPFDKHEVRQIAIALCDKWQMARRYVELESMVEARTAEFKHAALHDALTGLPNRALFADRLNNAMKRARRNTDYKIAVLFVDVDEFKFVNDSLGHDAGDQLLLQVAERVNDQIRDFDTVARVADDQTNDKQTVAARLGGDEFAVILENLRSDADAARVGQRLVDTAAKPYLIKGHSIRCTLSIGITTNSIHYEKPEEMIRDADTAMYHAKRQGRARFAIFDRTMHDSAVARLTFESDLRGAIANNEIQVHYQPIVTTDTHGLIGFEALARWQHPTKGWIPPADFIPIAEEAGLIVPLGLKILEQACRQLAAWQASNPEARDLTMSVNLSRKQLASPDIVEQIARVLRETGVQPRSLKIEITESCVMTDPKAAVEVLKRIQNLGVQLQIDDFGTGYSSLSCLQTFPLHGLKVDRQFVKEISEKPDQANLLGAIVTLAHSMNVPLVSEGVETPEQALMLKKMGCDFAQGFLFAKPMDSNAASNFISKHFTKQQAA